MGRIFRAKTTKDSQVTHPLVAGPGAPPAAGDPSFSRWARCATRRGRAMSAALDRTATRGVEEDIIVPLLARLATIRTLLHATPAPAHQHAPPADDDGDSRAQALAQLEKVRREIEQLEGVFRSIDDADKRIRQGFDPVEQRLDDALQDAQPDAVRIRQELLAASKAIDAIKASIRQAYTSNTIPCDDVSGGGDEGSSSAPAPAGTAVVMTRKMGQIRHGPQMRHLRLAVGGFEARLRDSVLCLAAFPEGAVIRKRLLIHWWLGEGFVRSADDGNSRFNDLHARGFIIPIPTALCGTVHRCTVRPWMRDLLIGMARSSGFLELDPGNDFTLARRACLRGGKTRPGLSAGVRAIYNIDQKYVELDQGWFAGKKELRALQLGQWREFDPAQQITNPMDSHIEVSGVERLADMGSCKSLRYASFRGISRIESLPDSIGKLLELVVLDLRACHNLEELGQGITKLDRLEYLDLSECHLLGGMPKGLGRLTRLEVLKGFVVANSSSKDPCHLSELAKLKKLKKLGIVIGKMAAPTEDEFLKLAEFKALESLKIRWGVLTSKNSGGRQALADHPFALPPSLKKLDLHCFPLMDFAQWPAPMGVKKLYIRGGKLTSLGDEEGWEAEVLRLRFLNDLQYDHTRLRRSFRKLKPENTEIHKCPNFALGE